MKNIFKITLITSFVFAINISKILAQNPVPAKAQTKTVMMQNCTIHVGNGSVINNGEIVFSNGLITYVGPVTKNFPNNSTVINLEGKHVYPGLISMDNHLGLSDVESIAAVNDYQETGSINPNVRTLVAFNTDSDVIPTVRGNGILISQAAPVGGLISGQSTVFNLDGWNWQDAALKIDDGVWLNWPAMFSNTFSLETMSVVLGKNEKRKESVQELSKLLKESLAYSFNKSPRNLKLEAMIGLFDGTKTLNIRSEIAKEIIEAVQFAKAHQVKKIAIFGGSEAAECADFLKENNIPVVFNGVHEVPTRTDDPVYTNYNLPNVLYKAGIQTVISYGGLGWRTRNLPFLAGTAVASGLDKEQALKMITLNPAQIMGIDKLVGSLEVGKQATLIVSKGDILDMRFSEVQMAYIQGKEVDLNDKQKNLYKKFSQNIGK